MLLLIENLYACAIPFITAISIGITAIPDIRRICLRLIVQISGWY